MAAIPSMMDKTATRVVNDLYEAAERSRGRGVREDRARVRAHVRYPVRAHAVHRHAAGKKMNDIAGSNGNRYQAIE